jgi:hypothetical protein
VAREIDRYPPWTVQAIEALDEADVRARRVAGDLSVAQLYWRPAPQVWSIGQCLQHLLQSNDVYVPPMARALEGRPASPVETITPGWFGRWFLREYIEPSPRSGRHRAPRKVAPHLTIEPDVLERFVRSNDVARDFVRRASVYDVNHVRFVNPFQPLIRFTVGTGIEILWRHQRRHLLQAEGVAASPGFPPR